MARRLKAKPNNLAWLRSTLNEKDITQRDLSRRLHSNATSINHKLHGRQAWNVEELSALAGILSLSMPELLRSMGYDSPEDTGNEIVGRVASGCQVSTIVAKRGLMFASEPSRDEKVLLIDDDSGQWKGGAVYYLQTDIGPTLNVLAIIEAPGMLLPVLGTLHGAPGKYLIRPLSCGLAPIEAETVLRVQPVTRLTLAQRPIAQPGSRGK